MLNLTAITIFIFTSLTGSLPAQIIFPKPLSDRIANYDIEIELNTDKKFFKGKERLRWKNLSDFPVTELQFHLYMNAFRSQKSTFMSNRRASSRSWPGRLLENPGKIDISSLILDESHDLTDQITFFQPDDENIYDSTVVRIALPETVKAGREIILDIEFECQLPQIIARTGYVQDLIMLGQWFPKIGVWEGGQWNCHQFHSQSEFYADFGVYEVSVTLPKRFVVGATGLLLNEEIGDSLKTLTFRAEDVHDFALTAWPGYKISEFEVAGVDVKLLFAQEHEGQLHRYYKAIQSAIVYLNQWLIPYPYPNLTVVDMPWYARHALGMEYPCFIVAGSLWGFPESIHALPEEITIHEYAHQYFYGLVASNEFEEPWLDEGFTSYATLRTLNKMYGYRSSYSTLLNIRKGMHAYYRENYLRMPDLEAIVKPSWEFTRKGYGVYLYDKSALVLATLEKMIGRKEMDRIMFAYVDNWKFRHPSTQDFIDIVNQHSGNNLNWFFDQALYGTDVVDFTVDSLVNNIQGSAFSKDDSIKSWALIRRRGNFRMPTEILFSFSGGKKIREKWNCADTMKIFTFYGTDSLIEVQVDPENKIYLDVNWTNNSFTVNENRLAFYRHWLKSLKIIQQILVNMGSF